MAAVANWAAASPERAAAMASRVDFIVDCLWRDDVVVNNAIGLCKGW